MKDTNKLMSIGVCTIAIVFVLALIVYILAMVGVMPLGNKVCMPHIDVGLFISLLGFSTAVAFAVPTFISKQQIKDVVKEYLAKDYKEDIETRADNLLRTDAHLSRMIGFLLMKNRYYYWAIGWGFRALKRYKGIPGDYQKIYREFHEMTLRNVILKSIRNREEDCCDDIVYAEDDIESKNDEIKRIKIRAIKDFVDFEYEIYDLEKKHSYAKELKENFSGDLDLIHSGMIAIWKELNKECEDDILAEILKISSHKKSAEDLKKFINMQYDFGGQK